MKTKGQCLWAQGDPFATLFRTGRRIRKSAIEDRP